MDEPYVRGEAVEWKRLAYNQKTAAAQLSMSVDTFVKSVRPYVGRVYIGRRALYPATELQAWLDREAMKPEQKPNRR